MVGATPRRGDGPPGYSRPLSVVLLVNPKSGRGIAGALADRLERALVAEGVSVKRLAACPPGAEGGVEPVDPARFRGAGALVVVGGDGTLNRTAEMAVRTATPVYHIPVGNENLFARQFGMTRSPEALLTAVRRKDVVRTDLARVNGRPFLIMASIGPDAGVVHRLASMRTKAIGHLAYLQPTLEELGKPAIARVSIEVDGERVVDSVRGWTIVANAPEYACRANPARHANALSGRLDVVFMPCYTAGEASWWIARSRLGWHLRDRKLVYRTGREIVVRHHSGRLAMQVDGEAMETPVGGELRFRVEAGALPVLRP